LDLGTKLRTTATPSPFGIGMGCAVAGNAQCSSGARPHPSLLPEGEGAFIVTFKLPSCMGKACIIYSMMFFTIMHHIAM
jgi:hypothetical protein